MIEYFPAWLEVWLDRKAFVCCQEAQVLFHTLVYTRTPPHTHKHRERGGGGREREEERVNSYLVEGDLTTKIPLWKKFHRLNEKRLGQPDGNRKHVLNQKLRVEIQLITTERRSLCTSWEITDCRLPTREERRQPGKV